MERVKEERMERMERMEPMERIRQTEPWAEILTLGDARFGVLAGGPFDGRCYPLPEGPIPRALEVPGPGPGATPPLHYVLHGGLYQYQRAERTAA